MGKYWGWKNHSPIKYLTEGRYLTVSLERDWPWGFRVLDQCAPYLDTLAHLQGRVLGWREKDTKAMSICRRVRLSSPNRGLHLCSLGS